MDLSCKTCRYYKPEEYTGLDDVTYDETYGMCIRYPPERIDSATSAFPIVQEECFCGEHLPM